MSLLDVIPMTVCTDSYKAGHFSMYPNANKMVAYGEFRRPFRRDSEDTRFVCYGIRYVIKTFVERQWTKEDVEKADKFYSTHNAGNTPYPFPKDIFLKIVSENNGYIPVKIEALPEGTVAHIHTPVYQVTAEGDYARLVTYLETLLSHLWYPSTVATLSRRTKQVVSEAFEKSAMETSNWLINYKLHDFGFRGCTSFEQCVLGGLGHLLNFAGTDTMPAAYYAQFELNNGKAVGESIPATEHSVMTAWRTEKEAIENMISHYGKGLFACVLDSYDYAYCLNNIIPEIKAKKEAAGGHMVFRPDSGDPIEAVMMGMVAAEKAFGSKKNKKGYKVINNASVIQGDGIGLADIKNILKKVMDEGYSAESVTFGMGSGLLQKVNRDTMSFATKLSYIEYADGTKRNVMKYPKTDGEKVSFPGILKVVRNKEGIPIVYPVESKVEGENLLKVVYDKGPVKDAFTMSFDELKQKVEKEWNALPAKFNPTSAELKKKSVDWVADMKAKVVEMQKAK